MKLLSTVFLTSIGAGIGMACSLVMAKTLAVFVGAAGFAIIGQFVNFVQLSQILTISVYQQAVVKYTSEFADDADFLRRFFHNLGGLIIGFSVVCFVIIEVFAAKITVYLFNSDEFVAVVRTYGFVLIAFAFNNLFLGTLNGLRYIKRYVLAQSVGSLVSVSLGFLLIYHFQLVGALYAQIFAQAGLVFFTAWLLKRTGKFEFRWLLPRYDSVMMRKTLMFASMAITSTIALPLSQFLVRSYLIENLGLVETGYWEAMNRISIAATSVLTLSLTTYFLPTLSKIHDKKEILHEILHCYYIFAPIMLVISIMLWLLRDFVIQLLFSTSFLPMRELFAFQAVGMFFRILSWVIGNLMWAKAMTKLFIISEIVFISSFVGFTVLFVELYGFQGCVMGFCVNYILYFLFTLIVLVRYVRKDVASA
jgi:O-antigen/teichoic acid export membrane protein